jgi:hypothetical protein
MRLAESQSPTPAQIREERKALEHTLGIEAQPDETWRPAFEAKAAFIAAIALCVILFTLVVIRRRTGRPRLSGRLSKALVPAACAAAVLSAIFLALVIYCGYVNTRTAVALNLRLYSVPEKRYDPHSAGSLDPPPAFVPAGTRLRILQTAGSWRYVETPAGVTGWTESECIRALLPQYPAA